MSVADGHYQICVAIATKLAVISKDADKIRSITQTIVAPNNCTCTGKCIERGECIHLNNRMKTIVYDTLLLPAG